MTWYTFFKSVHVVTAVVWVGGAAMIQAYAIRILATGDGKRQAEFAKDTEVVGMRVFIPSSLILVLAAIGMMVNLHWSWSQNWIILGLIAFALSFVRRRRFSRPRRGTDREAHRAAWPRCSCRQGTDPPHPHDLALRAGRAPDRDREHGRQADRSERLVLGTARGDGARDRRRARRCTAAASSAFPPPPRE